MKAIKGIQVVMEKICAVLMIIMCLCSFAQVGNRLIFEKAFYWTDEITIFSMVWLTFMGSALAVSKNSHTRIDFFVNLLPGKIKKWVDALANLVCAAFCVILVFESLPVFQKNLQIYSSGLHWPMAINYVAVLLGGITMVLFFVLLAVHNVKSKEEG